MINKFGRKSKTVMKNTFNPEERRREKENSRIYDNTRIRNGEISFDQLHYVPMDI